MVDYESDLCNDNNSEFNVLSFSKEDIGGISAMPNSYVIHDLWKGGEHEREESLAVFKAMSDYVRQLQAIQSIKVEEVPGTKRS